MSFKLSRIFGLKLKRALINVFVIVFKPHSHEIFY
jgi:hypothetical protein